MYLAEDRIMCLEIIVKENNDYLLAYIPGWRALTGAPTDLNSFIRQRRRWINGSVFASYHVIWNMYRVKNRSGSCCRKFGFLILYFYILFNVFIGLIIVGLYYAAFSIFVREAYTDSWRLDIGKLANIFENIYLFFLVIAVVLSTGVHIDYAENLFKFCSMVLGVLSLVMFFSMIYHFNWDYKDGNKTNMSALFIVFLIFSYFFPLIFHTKSLEIVEFIRGVFYLIFMVPTFINILSIYSVSNIHDVSWGSKPTTKEEFSSETNQEKNRSIAYRNYRSKYLIIWLIINIVVGFSIVSISRRNYTIVLGSIATTLTVIVILKVVFGLWHILFTKYYQSKAERILMNKFMQGKVFEDNNYLLQPEFPEYKMRPPDDVKLDDYLKLTKGKKTYYRIIYRSEYSD